MSAIFFANTTHTRWQPSSQSAAATPRRRSERQTKSVYSATSCCTRAATSAAADEPTARAGGAAREGRAADAGSRIAGPWPHAGAEITPFKGKRTPAASHTIGSQQGWGFTERDSGPVRLKEHGSAAGR